MLVFWKEKLVFLAVPKTGTTAFAKALAHRADMIINDPPELKHAPLYRYDRFFRPMFEKVGGVEHMDIMAIVREPIDWLGSWYRYRQRDFLAGRPTSTQGISFDSFVREYCKGTRAAYANVGSQAKFLEARPNGLRATHLFRYEDQASTLDFLESRLGERPNLELENVSPRRDTALAPEVEDILRRKRDEEFALYNSIGPWQPN